jgi:hypothetical protein
MNYGNYPNIAKNNLSWLNLIGYFMPMYNITSNAPNHPIVGSWDHIHPIGIY